MIHKILLFLITTTYLLAPYTAKAVSVCVCGDDEFICYCCKSSKDFDDVLSLSKCRMLIQEESVTHPPTILEISIEIGKSYINYLSYFLISDNHPTKGYKLLPEKPPRITLF